MNIRTETNRKPMKMDFIPGDRMNFIESMKSIFGSFEGTLINKLENLWDELETLYS